MGFQPFLALSASAGSGKTFALSVRYVALLFLGESSSSILAATFTNKAAAEMRHRVVEALRRLDEADFAPFLGELAKQTGLSPDEILAKRPGVLRRFLDSPTHIVTLDSFFVSVLKAGALEIGLDPGFVTKEEASVGLQEAFLEELDREGMLPVLVELAIQMERRRVEGMTESLASLYAQDPLLPPFPEGDGTLRGLEGEIEALRASLYERVQQVGASATAVRNFAPATVAELFAKSVFNHPSLEEHRNYRKYLPKDPRIEEEYQQLRTLLGRWAAARERAVLHRLGRLYDHYRNTRISRAKSRNMLDFDDLGYFAYRLLYESLSKDLLYFRLDSRFRHILLDEFQDTSTLQFLLLKPLIDEIFAGKGQSDFRTFFYVGDTKQSLYRFRGGVEELFDRVAEHYGIEVNPLSHNYRSAKGIVESVNRWFAEVMPGYLPQIPQSGKEGYVEVLEAEEPLAEATAQALRLIDAGIDPERIAFLVATNKEGKELQERCVEAGIPTVLQTSSSLRTLPQIAALVRMAEHLYREEALDAEALLRRSGRKEHPDLGWYRPSMRPVEVLHRLLESYAAFDNDPNFLRLLEFAAGYESLPEFLEEFESSRIGVAPHTLRGARILTIHGSKGLEFDYVILLDRSGRGSSERDALIPRYNENLHIERFFYRISGRERFDETYAELLEERKAAAEKDRLNLLYVALTRAAEGMIVLKKPEQSIFEPLGMVPMRRGELPKIEDESKVQEEAPRIPDVVLSRYGRQEEPPTSEDEGEGPDYEAILFGTALHYALEMMEPFGPEGIEGALDAVRNRYGAQLSEEQIAAIASRMEALMQDEPFTQMLRGARIQKEQPLAHRGKLLQIDLLLDYGDRFRILDYKSSRKFAEHHRRQLRTYIEAVESITGRPAEGALVYLTEEGVEIEGLGMEN
ncbi:RecB-like helicase [Nitratifractor salsuginis]|uniref:DNA 3'-5' helicase n=1 Tax=Nitratifractor salsuginis (strain DSM 16511 / JCM 12458 / E9I37-1) TaxID=749222 RepID=E6X2G8_NITSE|nr:RecB-like helicase [Nitratifractor salsuginis]ADV47173.1 UvrD/REP helicase [Nitratifractor salsuginis DSM 16511]